MPWPALASVVLRTSSGSRRRSSPSNDEVEGVHEGVRVIVSVAEAVERRQAVLATGYGLAIDDEGPRPKASYGLDDQRETPSEVIAGAAVEPHADAVLAGNNAEAVMFDLMQPQQPARRRAGLGRQAGRKRGKAV
jgi:hypothetical protein